MKYRATFYGGKRDGNTKAVVLEIVRADNNAIDQEEIDLLSEKLRQFIITTFNARGEILQ